MLNINAIQLEIEQINQQVRLMCDQNIHHYGLKKIKELHAKIHHWDKKAFRAINFIELDHWVKKVYLEESNNQVEFLTKHGKNLPFNTENFQQIPMNLNVNDLHKFFEHHPDALSLLKLIETRSLATRNGFCILKTDQYIKLTGKTRQTFFRQLKILESLKLINQINTTSSTKGQFYKVKVIRANRIFIKYFACGYKSRCNHLFYAKFLKPELLMLSEKYPIKWKTSKFSKHIPDELKWAYELKYDPYEYFREYRRNQIKGNEIQKQEAIDILGIEPYNIDCHDRPSMYELFHNKAPFWSAELQDVARKHMRWQAATFNKPFYHLGRDIILPKAIAWEMKMSRSQALKQMPESWIAASTAIISGQLAQ
jgi:hypothetical protein